MGYTQKILPFGQRRRISSEIRQSGDEHIAKCESRLYTKEVLSPLPDSKADRSHGHDFDESNT